MARSKPTDSLANEISRRFKIGTPGKAGNHLVAPP